MESKLKEVKLLRKKITKIVETKKKTEQTRMKYISSLHTIWEIRYRTERTNSQPKQIN